MQRINNEMLPILNLPNSEEDILFVLGQLDFTMETKHQTELSADYLSLKEELCSGAYTSMLPLRWDIIAVEQKFYILPFTSRDN